MNKKTGYNYSAEMMMRIIKLVECGMLVIVTMHSDLCINVMSKLLSIADNIEGKKHSIVQNLKAVITQRLLPTRGYDGLVAAYEVLLLNEEVKRCILEGKLQQLEQIMQGGKKQGMLALSRSLDILLKQGSIDQQVHKNAINQELYIGREKTAVQSTYEFLSDDEF